MYFGSDNQSGASEKVMQALVDANRGVSSSYGTDDWTRNAESALEQVFETKLKVYFVASGTAANCLALSCLAKPWDMILCHAQAHILNDELSAPEFYTGGARLNGLDLDQPKLSASSLAQYLESFEGHVPHTAEPSVLSLTQLSETGSAYTLEELRSLASIAKSHDMKVHMDGARFANALVALDVSPAEMTWRAGVDVLCLGASKNGALAAEAVIFFDMELAAEFELRRKRAGHLLSKGRLLGAQFCAWLDDNHWLDLAGYANQKAETLAIGIDRTSECERVWERGGNEVFALLNDSSMQALREQGAVFSEWPKRFLPKEKQLDSRAFVRLVVSHTTQNEEIDQFCSLLN
jgi:threonine aldolase